MKIRILLLIAVFTLPLFVQAQFNQDSTGYDGDHFSLEGVLELFKQSKSPEEFEKKINLESNYINNLDLNQDGEIDYIKVIDDAEDNFHTLALRVDLNENESQDVAVIFIEKTGENKAILQIIGDEDVFGEEKIVEPYMEALSPEGGKGNIDDSILLTRVVVNVWAWPGVKFIYAPGYVTYRSPWSWANYPNGWKPWRPHPWRWHYNKRKIYQVHYRPYHTHRIVKAQAFYKPKRKSSVVVKTRTTHTRTVVHKGVKRHNNSNTPSSAGKKSNKLTKAKGSKTTTTVTKSAKGNKVTISSRKKKGTKTKKRKGK